MSNMEYIERVLEDAKIHATSVQKLRNIVETQVQLIQSMERHGVQLETDLSKALKENLKATPFIEAMGLLTTAFPKLAIAADDPVGMANSMLEEIKCLRESSRKGL